MSGVFVLNDLSGLRPAAGDAVADVSVSTDVVGLSDLKGDTRVVLVQADPAGGDLRYSLDGSDPVGGSHGFVLAKGDGLRLSRVSAQRLKAVRNAAEDGKLAVQEMVVGG